MTAICIVTTKMPNDSTITISCEAFEIDIIMHAGVMELQVILYNMQTWSDRVW